VRLIFSTDYSRKTLLPYRKCRGDQLSRERKCTSAALSIGSLIKRSNNGRISPTTVSFKPAEVTPMFAFSENWRCNAAVTFLRSSCACPTVTEAFNLPRGCSQNSCFVCPSRRRVRRNRRPDFRQWARKYKGCGHNPDDSERLSIEFNIPSDDRRIAAEPTAPQAVTQNHERVKPYCLSIRSMWTNNRYLVQVPHLKPFRSVQ